MKALKSILISTLILSLGSKGFSQETTDSLQSQGDLFQLSIEDLLNVEITSVAKKVQKLKDVASSIYVINKEDLQNSPHTRLPDLLKTVPGFFSSSFDYLHVTSGLRADADNYLGTVLVLIDGVPIHSPFLSAFDYSSFDIPLSAIERIEIIKGPGGTLYGSNTATGVINIFTTADPGIDVQAEYGVYNFTNLSVKGGTELGNKGSLNAYFKVRRFDEFPELAEFSGDSVLVPVGDGTIGDTLIKNRLGDDHFGIQTLSGGVRFKYDFSDTTSLTSGLHLNKTNTEEYSNTILSSLPFKDTIYYYDQMRERMIGHARLVHRINDNHDFYAQGSTSFENTSLFSFGGLTYETSMFDFEGQDNLVFGRHKLTSGINLRLVNFNVFNVKDPGTINFIPDESTENLMSAFVQDKISIIDKKLDLTLGIKGEKWSLINEKIAYSPSARLNFNVSDKLFLWSAASRSNTTPGFIHTNVQINLFTYPSMQELIGLLIAQGIPSTMAPAVAAGLAQDITGGQPNKLGKSIALINGPETNRGTYDTYEFGFRTSFSKRVYLESNFFCTRSDNVIGTEAPDIMVPSKLNPSDTIIPYYYTNKYKGVSVGAETVVKTKVTNGITLELSHSWFQEKEDLIDGTEEGEWNVERPPTPTHIFRLKSYLKFKPDIKLNLFGAYTTGYYNGADYSYDQQTWSTTDNIPGLQRDRTVTDSRVIVDFRLEKSFMDKKLGVYLWGTDILYNPFVEQGDAYTIFKPAQVGRIYGIGLTYRPQ